MSQINAFEILGATPSDDLDRLQELLDEKELLSEDPSAAQNAYGELTNPKKRLLHEITYIRADMFEGFYKLIFKEPEKPSTDDVADVLVEIGQWFEESDEDLFFEINECRNKSGFKPIEDESVLFQAIDNLRSDAIQSANEYIDSLKKQSVVSIFNKIVKIDNYESFFIDELLAHYELIIKETIQGKEKECRDSFSEIEQICNRFNSGQSLSSQLDEKVSEFKTKLKNWDHCAQPLQVNMQCHGGQHEDSERLLRDLRNKVIDLCNESQNKLGSLLTQWQTAMSQYNFSSVYSIRQQINERIPDSLRLVENLISIIDIFKSVFAELDIDYERLSKDKEDLIDLKKSLTQLNQPIQQEKQRQVQARQQQEQASKNGRVAHGVFAGISLFIMIICFASGSIGGGVAFLIIASAFAMCCGFYPQLEGKKIMPWIIGIGIFIAIMAGAGIGSNTNTSSSSSSKSSSSGNAKSAYTVTLNKDGGTGGTSSVSVKYGDSMPYATAPSKSGYEFGGYYTSKNGSGTKYYTATMSSNRTYDKSTNTTLYAYWIEADDSITLTKSNFETYFTLSSSCSVSRSSYGSSGTATYNFSISPKSSFRYSSNSKNPSSITVTIGLDISSLSSTYGTPSEYKITVTLYKSSGYSYSGSRTYSVGAYENYWLDGIYSVDGKIYK